MANMLAYVGPTVLYGSMVSLLSANFFLFPAMLLTGHKAAENSWRQTGLMVMCVTIMLDLLWANFHPKPVRLILATFAAAVSAGSHIVHLVFAFGLTPWSYSFSVAMVLQVATHLPWILVQQVGTDFVVRTGRSPARFQILAWITIMGLGTLVTLYPSLRNFLTFVLCVASAPRVVVTIALLLSSLASAAEQNNNTTKDVTASDYHSVAMPRAAVFALFACNGSVGEALNDMATDLKIRTAQSAGDTQLTLAYNAAVTLSMMGGYASETHASGTGARRVFGALWCLVQIFRSLGMELLTPDRTWLMFVFVFCDKFTGPLGQAAIDTALLRLMRRGRDKADGAGWPRMAENALWTVRTAADRLERPVCQMLLLRSGADNAPAWLVICFALIATGFVQVVLREGVASQTADKKAA
eukprot:TRINITY_DN62432_c0_g1_i1.p1 TRINITY_DN62432_c0_g1~~TRINITY_DN62432_c0_g1_i1.p1  ORF type:complete len:440 (-),score=43.10 TRINITY_DN62432_c0_g1_i1:22-1260(-)